jgi:FHA domain-containing protein
MAGAMSSVEGYPCTLHDAPSSAFAMIVITVETYNGQAVSGLSASFDEIGGTIGRAENNQLVLPDPDRTISRVHAQVVFRNGGYAILDRGSNAVMVNGTPLGNGREAPIRDGDRLTIGGYELRVAVGQKAATDPFADLFGSDAPKPPAPTSLASERLFGPAPTVPARPAPAPPPPPAPAAGIPEDWDPFAPASAPASTAPAANPHLPELPFAAPSRADSLDALFGLGGGAADPFAQSPLAAPLAQPNTATDADPLRAFGITPTAAPAPASDHVSDLNTPWVAPPLREPAAPAPPPGVVLSWNQPSREGKVVTLPGGHPDAAPAGTPAARPEAVAAAGTLTQILPRAGAIAPVATAPISSAPILPTAVAPPVPGSAPEALHAALAEGLGVAAQRLKPLDAAQMRLIGEMLREATRGAVELLVARAALKREMRTEVTMIAARENNPLKFSPNADVALQHLMGEPMPGFMPPAKAMRDAFDDLRAHQLGVVAGMRSALEGVLQRFDPAQLETKIASKRSTLASLLPSMRKAELWELFTQLYAQLSVEAAEDFHELFGRAFRQAYEAHIDALQQAQG